MKISIVMPIYNAASFLDRSVGSVIGQTISNWELILVDDGSTDNSAQICDRYAEKYTNVIVIHKKNGGQYDARKAGISRATGDYVGFLDADDYLSADYVSILNRIIEENNFPEIVSFGLNEIREQETKAREVNDNTYIDLLKREDQEKMFSLLCEGKITGSLCSKIISTNLIKKTQVEDTYVKAKRYGEDYYQFLSIIIGAESVYLTDICLYNYIRNDNGTSLGFEKRDFDYFSTKYADKLLLDLVDKWKINSKSNIYKIIAKNFNESMYYLLRYFRSTKSVKRKIDCIKYDWNTYLLETDIDKLKKNPYVRESYKEVYENVINKRYLAVFFKEIIRWQKNLFRLFLKQLRNRK